MKLTQIQREEILSYLNSIPSLSAQYQRGLVIPLVSSIQEVTQYKSWSPYLGHPISTAFIYKIEDDFRSILDVWALEISSRYPKLAHILEDRSLFWIKVQVNDNDKNQVDVIFSPAIVNMYQGVADFDVFDWSGWTDNMLINFYNDLRGKEYGG